MLVIDMCSTEMRDSTTFSLTKNELHINVLGARSALSVIEKDIAVELSQNNFSGLEME